MRAEQEAGQRKTQTKGISEHTIEERPTANLTPPNASGHVKTASLKIMSRDMTTPSAKRDNTKISRSPCTGAKGKEKGLKQIVTQKCVQSE